MTTIACQNNACENRGAPYQHDGDEAVACPICGDPMNDVGSDYVWPPEQDGEE